MRIILVTQLCLITYCLADELHPSHQKSRSYPTSEDIDYWRNLGLKELHSAQSLAKIENRAKNIIVFVGDGMSLPTLTASRIYKAQRKSSKASGEESLLTFEQFPHVGLSKTYCIDQQTSDSASTATALFTGVKTKADTLGFDHNIDFGNAESIMEAAALDSILAHAQRAGKDTGFVTTARVTHATPASLYAHVPDRDWECFDNLLEQFEDEGKIPENVHDIAWQLMNQDPGRNIKVILGGGKANFLPPTFQIKTKGDYEDYDYNCACEKHRNFISEFLEQNPSNVFVSNKTELFRADLDKTNRLIGLFSHTHMLYEHERRGNLVEDYTDQPSLAEMTKVAIDKLSKNVENGFFLMVEGAKIDHAHHSAWANAALDETVAFDEAVEVALDSVNLEDTLVIVTADHGHTMSMAGYQSRGSDVRGLVDLKEADDKMPYLTLSYANGKGFKEHLGVDKDEVERADLDQVDYMDWKFRSPGNVPMSKETHSSADVGIFAQGPFAHFIHGVHEQTYVYYLMAYSACLDMFENEPHCSNFVSQKPKH